MRMYQTEGVTLFKDWDAMREQSMYNPPSAFERFGQKFTILAGTDDDVTVYHDRDNVYVVAENHRLDYIGLERFNRHTGEREFDIFFQTDDGSGDKDWLLDISRYPTKINFMLQWDM